MQSSLIVRAGPFGPPQIQKRLARSPTEAHGFKTPSARRSNRRPIDHRSPRRLRPALHLCPDRKSNNHRPGSGAPGRLGSDDGTRLRGSSRRTGGLGRRLDGVRLLDRSTKLSPKRGSAHRSSIGRERMPAPRPTLRGSQSNPSCRFPRCALSNLTPPTSLPGENQETPDLRLPLRRRSSRRHSPTLRIRCSSASQATASTRVEPDHCRPHGGPRSTASGNHAGASDPHFGKCY